MPILSVTETLFGGLVFSAILFFVSRMLKLSTFWSGVLSGLIPFALYIAYSTQHWVGGDVLTIHFAIFLAASGLFIVFGNMRDKQQKMHWAPKLIVGFFIGLVLLNAVLLTISSRGLPDFVAGLILPRQQNQRLHTVFPGTVPHDFNKSYLPHLQRLDNQRNLGWQIEGWEKLAEVKHKNPFVLTIKLSDKSNSLIENANLSLALWRVANSMDDQTLTLKQVSPGVYQTSITLAEPGRWFSQLTITHGSDEYLKQQQLNIE